MNKGKVALCWPTDGLTRTVIENPTAPQLKTRIATSYESGCYTQSSLVFFECSTAGFRIIAPYVGGHPGGDTNLVPKVFNCKEGLKRMQVSGKARLVGYYAGNRTNTYVWNHVYSAGPGRPAGVPAGMNMPTTTITGRHTSRIVSTSIAVVLWELPYWNDGQSSLEDMPHRLGINLTYADGHAAHYKGVPAEYDWWAFHSQDGWDY